MKISKISVQKSQKGRYNVFSASEQGETFAFSIDEDVLVKYGLKKGMSLSEEEIENILGEDEHRKALHLALRYLSYAMRTEKQIADHLINKGRTEAEICHVLKELKRLGYVNDGEYAKAFVRTHMNTSHKGPLWIKEQLKQKGVANLFIENALEQFQKEDQLNKARTFVEKKAKQQRKESINRFQMRMKELLWRHGYSQEVAQEVISELHLSKRKEDEWNALCYHGEKAARKYNGKYEKAMYEMKLKQYLTRRGFQLDDIESWFKERAEHL